MDRQERICREIAERLGLAVVDSFVFIDNNRSAWKRDRKRPGWDRLLTAIQSGNVMHVLTYHPDRLMRQPRDLEELLTLADDQDLTLHGQANRRDLSDPDDRFFLRIEVAHACRSSDDTSRRVMDNMADRARDGKPHGGKRRYGYAADQRTIIEHEAKIVKEIFTRTLDGATVRDISKDLYDRGEPTALGNEWNDYTVRAVLKNRHVAGIQVFRGEEVGDGDWPAIIERGLWDEVQALRKTIRSATSPTRAGTPRYYLLRGLVTCKKCGTNMGGSGGSYLCNRSQLLGPERCGRKIAAGTLERFVKDAALIVLETLDLSGRPTAHTEVSDADAAAIAADEAELAELKDMWDNQELKTPEYREMRKVVQKRIDDAQRRTVVRPAVEVLHGLVGPEARDNWAKLEAAGDYVRLNAVMRFLYNAVLIDASSTKGKQFDYSRIYPEANSIWFR